MGKASVTVVVPHYGSPKTPLPLLRGLARQRACPPLQVIVVDDASPRPLPPLDGVTVLRRGVNGGFGAAANTGAAGATGELMLLLNSDLVIGEGFVRDLVVAAEPWMPAVVSPRVVGTDGTEAAIGRRFPRVRHQVVEWLVPLARWRALDALHRAVGHEVTAPGLTAPVDWVVGAALLLPLGEFRAVGGFDPRFFMNSEEVDLQRRLRERGLPSVVLDRPTATHEGGGSSDPALRRRWLVESRLAYADKWGGRRRLQAGLAAATAVNLVWNTGRRVAGRRVAPLAAAREELSMITRRSAS